VIGSLDERGQLDRLVLLQTNGKTVAGETRGSNGKVSRSFVPGAPIQERMVSSGAESMVQESFVPDAGSR